MLSQLRFALKGAWRWFRTRPEERRVSRSRERFWSEVREGQREAECDSRGPGERSS